ncbi:hypothetical protein VKA52_14365 [Halobacillus sp. HZG1]|uniref:hypothetical protein n=1 Tax=Halobacillus sp. HZG1 TaxID=3111769 RepID=UPI002DBF0E2E|nr:hypothetical protein [Halobacillus sp. HZG1]MEC3884916.1 hypothetical protein [Halobacillus sp. HZG1]
MKHLLSERELQLLKNWTGKSIQVLQSDFFQMNRQDFKNGVFSTSETLVINTTPAHYLVFELNTDVGPDFEDVYEITIHEKQTPSPLPYEEVGGLAHATRSSGLSLFRTIERVDVYQKCIGTFYYDHALVFSIGNGDQFCLSGDGHMFWVSFNQNRIDEKVAGCSIRWRSGK